jgi:hypothetical protein
LRDWIRRQDALHVDQTGWRTAGDSRALWTMTTSQAAIFEIAERCNREQFDALIAAFSGVVISDRWPGYGLGFATTARWGEPMATSGETTCPPLGRTDGRRWGETDDR